MFRVSLFAISLPNCQENISDVQTGGGKQERSGKRVGYYRAGMRLSVCSRSVELSERAGFDIWKLGFGNAHVPYGIIL